MVKAFEEASGVKIPLEMAGRRPGDVAESYATCDLAEKELGFKYKYTTTMNQKEASLKPPSPRVYKDGPRRASLETLKS